MEFQRFLGFVGFYSKFIENFSTIAAPLTMLSGRGVVFEFGAEQRLAFQHLKKAMMSKPVLKLQPQASSHSHDGRSGQGWGAVLEQEGHPVEFTSGKWTLAESRYSTSKQELKAALNAVRKFHYYLAGIHFTLVTDHQAFQKDPRPKFDQNKMAKQTI